MYTPCPFRVIFDRDETRADAAMLQCDYPAKYQNATPTIAISTITIPVIFIVLSKSASSVLVMRSLCVVIGTSIVHKTIKKSCTEITKTL